MFRARVKMCLESEMSCEPEIMTSDFLYQSINILCLQPQIFLLDWLMFPRSEPECETPNVYITWYSDIFQINVNHSWKWKNIVVPHENLCSIQNSDILYLYWKIIWIRAEICYHSGFLITIIYLTFRENIIYIIWC